MATHEMIASELSACAQITNRTFSPDDIDDLSGPFARRFLHVSNAELSKAFDRWLDAQGDRSPQALPTPNQIWAHHKKGAAAIYAPDSTAKAYERPTRAFRLQSEALRHRIETIGTGMVHMDEALDESVRRVTRPPHRHKAPTFDEETGHQLTSGREDCTACDKQEERWAQIAEVIAEGMPVAREPKPLACECGGDGFMETKAGKANRTALRWQGHTEVYPCKRCRPEQFHLWRTGETLEADTEA
eukprot:GHVR01064558.1.p1 GENE.GHVR01064558.1~~GHVR01064558.1.p1  ORF type:complete len:245 (+),score=42.43 GHVR01064558.1:675-1409(+)